MEIKNFEDLKKHTYFKRTMLADIKIAKLCPGGNIEKINEILQGEDFSKKFDFMVNLLLIMNDCYNSYCDVWDKEADRGIKLNEKLLYTLKSEEIAELTNYAFADFVADGEKEVEAQAKKNEDPVTLEK